MKILGKEYKTSLAAIMARVIKGKKITDEDKSRIRGYGSLLHTGYLKYRISKGTPFSVKIKNKNISLIFSTTNPLSFCYLFTIKYNGKTKKIFFDNKYNENSETIKDDISIALRKSSIRNFYIKDNFLLDKIEEFL